MKCILLIALFVVFCLTGVAQNVYATCKERIQCVVYDGGNNPIGPYFYSLNSEDGHDSEVISLTGAPAFSLKLVGTTGNCYMVLKYADQTGNWSRILAKNDVADLTVGHNEINQRAFCAKQKSTAGLSLNTPE